jgi:hypothetical protein
MNDKYAQFLAQKLEYLPPKVSSLQKASNNTLILSPGEIEAKKGGYLQPPTQEELDRMFELEQQKKLAQQDFYNEINENKKKSYDKVIKLAKYNPFVPIGCLITIGVLMNGVYAMRMKDRNKSQRMMRYRVAAQGSTIIALCIGTMIANHLSSD